MVVMTTVAIVMVAMTTVTIVMVAMTTGVMMVTMTTVNKAKKTLCSEVKDRSSCSAHLVQCTSHRECVNSGRRACVSLPPLSQVGWEEGSY